VFSTDGTLTGITEVDVRTGSHTFTVDEPPALGGGGTAPKPVEYALASLGSCQAITYRFWAEHLGVSVAGQRHPIPMPGVSGPGSPLMPATVAFGMADATLSGRGPASGCGPSTEGRRDDGETPEGDFLGDPFDHRRHLYRDRRLLAVRDRDWWQVHVSGMAVCLTCGAMGIRTPDLLHAMRWNCSIQFQAGRHFSV
jgi:hypothetical protein